MHKKLSTFEAIFIIIMIAINTILLNVPKMLIDSSGTGAFCNCIFVGLIALIYVIIIIKLFKIFPTWDILDISKYLGGKVLQTIIGILFILLLFLSICISISNIVVLLKTVYFENSPMLFLILFFIIGILFCNTMGFGAIKQSLCFYFPITLVTLLIVLKSKISPFSLLKITPIFGNNIKDTFFYGLSNIFLFTNILFLYFLPPYLDDNKKFKKISILSFIICWVLYILSIITLLTAYPLDNMSSDINSLYILTKRIQLSNFIQRSDGVFVFIWLLSFFAFISLLLYLITNIIKKVFNIENERMLSYSLISIIIGTTYYFIISNFYKFDGIDILKYLFILTTFVISFFILIFSAIKKKKI